MRDYRCAKLNFCDPIDKLTRIQNILLTCTVGTFSYCLGNSAACCFWASPLYLSPKQLWYEESKNNYWILLESLVIFCFLFVYFIFVYACFSSVKSQLQGVKQLSTPVCDSPFSKRVTLKVLLCLLSSYSLYVNKHFGLITSCFLLNFFMLQLWHWRLSFCPC